MKAISLWQPWASLWCAGPKIHETRHWPTSHRGWLAVHAAKRKIDDFSGDPIDKICSHVFGPHWGMELPLGAIVGVVNIVDCLTTEDAALGLEDDDYECGDFSPGRFAWKRKQFIRLGDPIPYRGAQGIFTVPDDILPSVASAA